MPIRELPDFIFNPEKHYLGSLCKRKHRYKNNQSIRRKCNGNCLYCERLNNYDWGIDHPHKQKAKSKRWRENHPDYKSVIDRTKEKKDYYQANKEQILEKQKVYRKQKILEQLANKYEN